MSAFYRDAHPHRHLADAAQRDIQVLKTYGAAPYGSAIKKLEQQIKEKQQSVDEKIGVKVPPTPSVTCTSSTPNDSAHRNQTPVSPHPTSGMSPPTANECPRSNHFR
jgi:uncharacterized protein YegL